MRYLITGKSSKFAQEASRVIALKGHEVTLIGQSSCPPFTLENPEESIASFINETDYLIHFAHSFEKQTLDDVNAVGAAKIIDLCSGTKIKKLIYISSDSASRESMSHYGQSKFRTENVFLQSDKSLVLRVGIVLDKSVPSPFQLIKRFVKSTKTLVFPSPRFPLFRTATVDRVVEVILKACENDIVGGPFTTSTDIRLESIQQVLSETGITPIRILPIPLKILIPLAYTGRKLGFFRRYCDSVLSVVTVPEECRTIQI